MSGMEVRTGTRRSLYAMLAVTVALDAALAGSGAYLGLGIVLAASVVWLLLFVLVAGALRVRADSESADRRLPAVRLAGGLLVLGVALVVFELGSRGIIIPRGPAPADATLGALFAGTAAIAFGLGRWAETLPRVEVPDGPGLANASRVAAWLGLAGAVTFVVPETVSQAASEPIGMLLLAVPGALAAELVLRGLVSFVRRPAPGAAFGTDLVVSRVFGSSYNPLRSILVAAESTFGVDVRNAWVLGFLRSVSLPVLAGFVLFVWLLTSVGVVDASQLAVRERFGRVDADLVLEPGPVVGLPWPFDRVRRVDVQRVRSLPLGYSDAKSGVDALWTQYHAAEEYNLLLGNGRDLITVNAQLDYRIGDIHRWLYSCQNPEQALQTLAYRVLMEATVDKTLDDVLSRDIAGFSTRMHERIQRLADAQDLGVEVLSFNLRGLHPPVAVAEDYQAVVAAQLDQTTFIMQAESYREVALPMAQAFSLRKTLDAQAERAGRLATANGEATAFNTLLTQYTASPGLYRFRKRLETLEDILVVEPHVVLDSRIEQDGGAVWILK